jgi:hypothetical protein
MPSRPARPPAAPAVHRLEIPRWHPARLNELLGDWRRAARRKKADRRLVAGYFALSGIPRARCRRRVRLVVTLGPRQRGGDPDCYWKSTLDALCRCGALVDDNRQGVELGPVEFERGEEMRTVIVLEDMP